MFMKYLPVFVFFALAVGITLEIAGSGITGHVVQEDVSLGVDLVDAIGPLWRYESEGESAILMQNGQFSIQFVEPSKRDVLYYPNIQLVPGKNYELSFMGLSRTGNDIVVNLAGEDVFWSKRILLGQDYKQYVYEITVPEEAEANLNFFFSSGKGSSYVLADVALKERPYNFLKEGSFESGKEWVAFSDADMRFSLSNEATHGKNSAKLTVFRPGTEVRLYQDGIPLSPNTRYRLSFDARSNNDDKMFVHLGSISGVHGFTRELVYLTPEWKRYGIEFTSTNQLETFATLAFDVAPFDHAGDEFYFDRVVLEKIG